MTTTFNSAKKFIALLGLTFLLPALTLADTITVDTFSDDFDEEAPCSLREAVASANNDSPVGGCTAGNGADTIVLAAGEYVLSIACDYDIDEVSADGGYDWGVQCSDLDVTETLTITGAGKTSTTINVSPIQDTGEGNYNNFRAFDLKTQELMAEGQPQCDPSCVEGNVLTLNGMTITGGADNRGGAVRIDSNSCLIS